MGIGMIDAFRSGAKSLGLIIKLAFVNFVLSLINVGGIMSIIQFSGFRVNFMFTLPTVIPTLWDFIGMDPVNGVSINPGNVLLSALYVVVAAFLQYFYIYYMIRRLINPSIGVSGRRLIDIFLYNAILLAVVLMIMFTYIGTASMPLTTLLIILYLIAYYFIYGTPYIVVLRNAGLREALNAAVKTAVNGDYLTFTILYGLITLVLSPVMSAIAYGGKIIGIIVASAMAAPIGLWLSASTLMMMNHLIKP